MNTSRMGYNYGVGILLSSGTGNAAYNNLIYNNTINLTGFGAGIQVLSSSANGLVYNNTVYQNGPAGGILIYAGSRGTIVKNNIAFGNLGGDIVNDAGPDATIGFNLTSDPKFVNAGTFDFHLQSTSPAIDAGTTLSLVTTDFDGRPRPQGSAYDIGAYEYGGIAPTPTPFPTPTPPPDPGSTDTVAPTVTITSPAEGASVSRGSVVTITATATDNVGISRVEFYVDGSLKCTDSVASYSCLTKISGRRGKTHSIEARVYDFAGHVGRHSITVKTQ
jgi:hypothetical protein